MADPPPNGAGRRETVTWAVGAAAASFAASWVSMVQVVQEPIARDVAALDRRVDEAVQGANLRLDELAARTDQWRATYTAEVRQDIDKAAIQAEERRKRMSQRQDEINSSYGQDIGALAGRFNKLVEERNLLLGEAFATRKQMLDHIAALDRRIQALEEAFDRLPMNGTYSATKPDRMGGR